ncbi:MAG: hypothetical protein NT018_13275 [Armatimonadetes bacterium]|nr:hypothetical protein [Armatimonadota bacterium]
MRKLSVVVFAAAFFIGVGQAALAAGMNLPPSSERVIKGSVVSRNGKPIAGAAVYYLHYDATSRKLNKTIIHADKKGQFSQASSGDDRDFFVAVAKGYSYASGRPDENGELTMTLWPSYKLKGKVVDENGKALAGVNVVCGYFEARSADGKTGLSIQGVGPSAISDKNGKFAIDHLADPSSFDNVYGALNVSKSAYASMECGLDMSQIGDDLTLVCRKACELEGKLSLPGNAGPAPEGYGVMVIPDTSRNNYHQPVIGKANRQGVFRVSGIPVGKVSVVVSSPGATIWSSAGNLAAEYSMPAKLNVELKSDRKNTLDLELCKGALVSGVVVDKSTGKPAAKAEIYIYHGGRPQNINPEILSVDEEGKFSARVASGDVKVIVQSYQNEYYLGGPDDAPPNVAFKVADGDVKTDVKLEIAPQASASSDYDSISKPIPADFELKTGSYDLKWDPEVNCEDVARMSCVKWDYLASLLVKKAPQLVSEKPRYWVYKVDNLGNGLIGLILDESKGAGKGYDKVYVDTDRDWDFSDETPMPLSIATVQKYQYAFTDWISITSSQGDQANAPLLLKLGAMWSGVKGDELYGNLFKKGAWKGTIETNKGAVECVLVDANSNGVYGDFVRRGPSSRLLGYGDKLYVNTNGAGKTVLADYGQQFVALNAIVKIGEKFYAISPSERGDKLNVEPYGGPMGSLSVRVKNLYGMSGTASAGSVIGNQGSFEFSSIAGKPMAIPAGEYRVAVPSMVVSSGSVKLKLGCEFLATAKVLPDKENVLDISGGKLTAAIGMVSKQTVWTVGKTEAFSLVVKMGEGVLVNLIGDGSVKYAPKVSFIDKNGKLVRTVTGGYT